MTRVRVMTYNIFMGGRKGAALTEVIRQTAPDVVLVNESPKLPVLWKRQCVKLVDAWRMRFVGGGREAGSNMLAVAGDIRVKTVTAETFKQPLLKPRRGIVAAQLRVDGKLFGVVSCHLSLSPAGRAREIERVIAAANALRGPVVVGGDLNESPGGPSWRRLRAAGFVDHGNKHWRTFPADVALSRIDALLVRGSVKVTHHGEPGVSEALQSRASDHRPVMAVLEI